MISVLIVTRNSVKFIIPCIKSIIKQFNKTDVWELIIVDGMSTDKTKEVAQLFLQDAKIDYSILDNPYKLLASGWNIGIKAANGEFVVRPDAHAEFVEGYIKNGVDILNEHKDLAGVGGTLITVADTYIGNLIATVLANPIGVGRSLFRTGVSKNTYTETAVYALYRKDVFYNIDFFNETLARNQDVELHQKILKAGYKFMTASNMTAKYHSRTTISKFLKQGFFNGFWVIKSNSYHLNHLVPMFFLIFQVLLLFISPKLLLLLLVIYSCASILAYIYLSKIYNCVKLPILVCLTFMLHISYGLGSVFGGFSRFYKQ